MSVSRAKRTFVAVSLVGAMLGTPLGVFVLADVAHLSIPHARAAGAGIPVVVVVFEDETNPVARRLRAELGGATFDVHMAKIAFGVAPRAPLGGIASVAAVTELRGCLRVAHDDASVEIWTTDPSGVLQLAEVVEGKGDELAVRAAEVLRARLMPAPSSSASSTGNDLAPVSSVAASISSASPSSAPTPNASATSPSPSTHASRTRATEAKPSSVGLEVGPAMVYSPGGVGAVFDVTAGVRWAPTRDYALRLFALLPLTRSRVETEGGSIDISFMLIGIGIATTLFERSHIAATIGGGVGLSITHMAGASRAPLTGRSLDVFGVVPYLRFALPLRLQRALALEPAFTAGIVAPRAAAEVVEREVVTFGRPLLVSEIVLTLEWP